MNSHKEEFLRIFNSIDFHKIKDHPNILIAAGFWEEERYNAAKTCYKFMRMIDDLIDDYKAAHKVIKPEERKNFTANLNDWLGVLIEKNKSNPLQKELKETIDKFLIPIWPLEAFAKSMLYDINHDGFATLETFLQYSQGASVAPASIFVHLNSISKKNGQYTVPPFDIKTVSTPCAIFSYMVHIIRDFRKDQMNNLTYFADDLIRKNNLTRNDLKEIALGKSPGENFRNLISEYYSIADEYRLKTYDMIQKVRPLLEPRYQLSLEIIFNLYVMVFERIDVDKGKFTTEELNPTSEETKKKVHETIIKFVSENNL